MKADQPSDELTSTTTNVIRGTTKVVQGTVFRTGAASEELGSSLYPPSCPPIMMISPWPFEKMFL
ncbi:MAG: hypothetical protein WAJ93_26580 [Candidatus Nitrosopolaris sp.]